MFKKKKIETRDLPDLKVFWSCLNAHFNSSKNIALIIYKSSFRKRKMRIMNASEIKCENARYSISPHKIRLISN